MKRGKLVKIFGEIASEELTLSKRTTELNERTKLASVSWCKEATFEAPPTPMTRLVHWYIHHV